MKLSKGFILRKNLDLIVLLLILTCFYQFAAVFFDYDLEFTNKIFYVVFGFSVCYTLLDLIFNKLLIKVSHIIAFVFIFIISFSLACQNIFLPELFDALGRSGLVFVRSFAVGGLSWFLVGMAVGNSVHNKLNNKLSWILMLVLLVMFFMTLKSGFIIQYSELGTGRGYDFYLDHLILGSYALIIIFFMNAFISKYSLIFFLASVFILFSLGGRGDVVVFLISFVVFSYIYNKAEGVKYVLFCVALIVVSLIYFNADVIAGDDDLLRMFSVFNLTQDSSYLARVELFLSSFDGLVGQFLFGNPNTLILKMHRESELSNNLGALSHNILSMWQFYGFLAFSFFFYYLITTIKFIKINKNYLIDPISRFGVFLFIFTTLSIFFTKSITFYPFWMSMGFWVMRAHNFPIKR